MLNRYIPTKTIPHPHIAGKVIPISGYWTGPGHKPSTLSSKRLMHLQATRRRDGRLKYATYPQWDRNLDQINNQSVTERKRQRLLRRIGL